MSLYDDIDEGVRKDSKPDVSGWSSGFKLLKSQLVAKQKTSSNKQNTRRRPGAVLPPVVDLKGSGNNSSSSTSNSNSKNFDDGPALHFNMITGKLDGIAVPVPGASPFIASEPTASLTGVQDEYEPLRPNDYEEFVKKRRELKQKEREEERKREIEEREKRRKERHSARGLELEDRFEEDHSPPPPRRRRRDEEEEEPDMDRPRRPMGGGAAIAPPKSLLEEDEVVQQEMLQEPGPPMMAPPNMKMEPEQRFQPPLGTGFGLAGSVASKIMAKYGYKEGQGLGKSEQGMSTALMVEKTSKRGGKIIHEKDIPKMEPPRAVATDPNLLKNPSKVILLRNMVGPGEVDEELEPETAEECTKYGKVIKCVIFEVASAEDDEAVRIFIEFERLESAIKAIVDLNGRYFGGRIVKAGFYNLDKFRSLELNDTVQ